MRYYCYNEYSEDPNSDTIITVSEDDIRKTYYPYWYSKMCEKYGQEVVDKEWHFEECINDWIVNNGAWESV